MISFQNKRVDKINEQIKMAKIQKIQYVKKIYEQKKLINLANMQKRMNNPVVPFVNPVVPFVNPVVSENSVLQNYILSVYGN